MRWLFLFVFSLNLVYVGWEMSQTSSENYTDVPALKNVQPIVLLSELKQQRAALAKADQEESKTGSVIADNAPMEEAVNNNNESEPVSSMQVAAAPQEAKTEKPEVKPEMVPEVVPETTKQPVVETVAKAEQAAPADVTPVKTASSASCFTLGPFRDLDKLRGLTREIKSYVVAADFRGREEKEQTLYWVYIQPEKSRAKAIETGRRLKAKKIKDFYVIRDGEKINGLSLGRFRNKKGAYGLAKKVKNLGFDVLVEPVFKTYTIYWLDYQLASGVDIPESIFEKHIKSAKKGKVSRLSRDCAN